MSKSRTGKLLARTIGGAMIACSAAIWLGGPANATPPDPCLTAACQVAVGPVTVGLALNPQPLPPGFQAEVVGLGVHVFAGSALNPPPSAA